MPFPLIPFFLGAATGAAVTYFLTDRKSGRSSEPAKDLLTESAAADAQQPRSTGSEVIEASDEREKSKVDR